MPGGNKFRQWYAVRNKLRAEGRWNDKDDTSSGRQRTLEEVGVRVPPAKQPRIEDPDSEGPPPLEGEEGDPDKDNYAGECITAFAFALDGWRESGVHTAARGGR